MFLGLDLGTTNVKALITDMKGAVVARGSSPVDRWVVDDGGVEQDIEQIWQATIDAIQSATSQVDASSICAVGVSSQGAAVQFLDAMDQPIGKVISWMDARGMNVAEELTAEVGGEFFTQRLGHGYCGIGPRQILRWQKDEPEQYKQVRGIGFVGDVIVQRLSGRRAHDATSLSITLLYNPWDRTADKALLERLGVKEDQLPSLLAATEAAGGVLPDVARQTGLPEGIPVSPAVHDQYAAALGAGAVHAGDVCLGTGTAWVILAIADSLTGPVTPGAFSCGHVVEGLYGQMLSMCNGGGAIDWVMELLNLGKASKEGIDARLAEVPPASEGLCFRPLFVRSSAQSTWPDAAIEGLKLSHTPSHILRSVVEGLGCELRRHLDMIVSAGLPIDQITLCGQAAASEQTPQILADITGLPVRCISLPDVSAYGATILSRAIGQSRSDLVTLAEEWAPSTRTAKPDETNKAAYAELLAAYTKPFS